MEKDYFTSPTNGGGDEAGSCDNGGLCPHLVRQVVDESQSYSIIRRSQEKAYPDAVFIVEPNRIIGQESVGDELR